MASSFYKKASEEVIDYKCSTCYKKKKEKKSEKFCVECQKYFCTKCLEAHNVINDDHNLQEPSQATGQVFLPTDRCPTHPMKLMDTYCRDHDIIECSTCAFDKHKSCNTVLYIPNEVGQLFKDEELQKARAGLDRVKDRLTEGGKLRNKWMESLQTELEKQLLAVDSYVETLVAIVRNLGKAGKKMLENKYKEEKDKLQQNTNSCQEVVTDVQKCRNQLDSYEENKAQLFVSIKKSQKIIAVADQLDQDAQKVKHQSPQFKFDRRILQYLAGLQTLGSLVGSSTLYTVGLKHDINIRVKEDKDRCNILGCCLLPDGSLLLSDCKNQKLKRLDTTNKTVIDHCSVPAYPYGTCCISQQEAAVCLLNNTIQFVSLGPHKMTLTRSIQLNHSCYGISYCDNKLCVSNWGDDVLFYTLSGSLIKSGKLGLKTTRNITFSESGDALYISDEKLGLIGVDISGWEIFRYNGLTGCRSVCVDRSGSVFAAGAKSKNVVQMTEKGQLLGEVVSSSDDALSPMALSFDCSRESLFIAGKSDTVKVIKMKKLQITSV